MNVALATATAQAPLPVMAARNGIAVGKGADTGTPSAADAAGDTSAVKVDTGKSGEDLPILGRYPRVAVRFDQDASRLVLLFRNPADGATVEQIPTEAALKQYREAQKDRKDGRSSLQLLVGGSDDGQARQPGQGSASSDLATGQRAGQGTGQGTGPGTSPHRGAGVETHTTSGYPPTVVHSTPATTHAAAPSGTSSGSGSARVNVVI
ncbi:hypothetical protein [Azospirillum rugosum]|uniref:Uncharacterized protein n=1 Tax=Azospirillum rugosum TaxID=416170 RepID=A0ABS4SSY2_9PROT|nr:hypothetical protein [Azospirillum rugosum]MBP2294475.1 hypothetical protein [Azospirillum rugosum]MDQ0528980.1 hypothetical protein [Azospirillum rugosum]